MPPHPFPLKVFGNRFGKGFSAFLSRANKGNVLPRGINDFVRLATLFNVLLTGISLHTGLLIGANISGIGQTKYSWVSFS